VKKQNKMKLVYEYFNYIDFIVKNNNKSQTFPRLVIRSGNAVLMKTVKILYDTN